MTGEACRNCSGEGWVCENHADRPWGGMSSDPLACDCGAGMPCGACNLEAASAGYVYQATQALQSKLDRATEALEYVRTAIRFDRTRFQEIGRTTKQADDAIAHIDATLAALKGADNA